MGFFNHAKFLKDLTYRFLATLFSTVFLFNVLAHRYQIHSIGKWSYWGKLDWHLNRSISMTRCYNQWDFFLIQSTILVKRDKCMFTQHANISNKAPDKFIFFPTVCFVRKWRLKFLSSEYRLRWNPKIKMSLVKYLQIKFEWN